MLGYIVFILLLLAAGLIKNINHRLIFMFVVITVFSSIRYGIGFDYYAYLESAMGTRGYEGTELVPKLMLDLSNDTIPFLFFFLSSIFISFFFSAGIKKGGEDFYLEVFFYVSFPFLFLNHLGIIRQGMATAVILLAIVSRHDKLYRRLFLILLAFLCHQSSFICLLILFPWERLHLPTLWFMLAFSFVASVFLMPLLEAIVSSGVLGNSVTERALYHLETEANVEGQTIKYLVYAIVIAILVFYKQLVRHNKENAYYIGLVVLGVCFFSIFSFNITLSKRFCMFFFSPTIFLVPQLVKVLKIPRSFYVLMCTILFALSIYVGRSEVRDEDPPGYSVTYPYRTVFQFLQKY